MRPLLAPLALLTIAAGASAAPFQLERLVIQGESLAGLPGPVAEGSIRVPSINSHGQWAVAVGTLNTQGSGQLVCVVGAEGRSCPGQRIVLRDRSWHSCWCMERRSVAVGLALAGEAAGGTETEEARVALRVNPWRPIFTSWCEG